MLKKFKNSMLFFCFTFIMLFTFGTNVQAGENTIETDPGSLAAAITLKNNAGSGTEGDYREEIKLASGEVTPTIGTKFSSGIYIYEVTKAPSTPQLVVSAADAKKVKIEVAMIGFVKGKSPSTLSVNSTVSYYGILTCKITSIANNAFYKNTKLKSVSISNNITAIGDHAFYKCTNLKKITLGTGLKKIGSHAFCNNKKLSNITIKSTKLTKVGKHNLYNCPNLKIKVPASKVDAYTKLFENQGQKQNVRITK